MALINPTIPTIGDANSTEDPDIRSGMITIRDEINGNLDNANIKAAAGILLNKLANQTAGQLLIANGSGVVTGTTSSGDITNDSAGVFTIGANKVTTPKILDANVTDPKLASPNNPVYRTVFSPTRETVVLNKTTTGVLLLPDSLSTAAAGGSADTFYIDDADFAVPNKTTFMRVRAQMYTNATDPGTGTWTFGLYSITAAAGGTNVIQYTISGPVAGSTVAYADPAASTIYPTSSATGFSTDVNISAIPDGHYVLGVALSGANQAVNSAVTISSQLQVHYA